ncbi:MAG: hypothetical protein EOP48_19735 [Sphingobacteriales bacterium]|nr:MAG: hypothetical protein EOP48_19735 [Sphingobacteriales bacterium]
MMVLNKKYWFLLLGLVAFILIACSDARGQHYTYKIRTYALDQGKNLLSVSRLISYEDYLFEFRTQVNIADTITDGSAPKRGITYTNKGGFYLLKNKSDLYVEFDSFSLNNKIVKKGKIAEKEFGVKSGGYDTSTYSNRALFKTLPIDTVINNVHCSYIDIDLAAAKLDSALEQKIFLYRDKSFNSFYKLGNSNYFDPNYCIIGIYFFDNRLKQGYLEEPDQLRRLTKEEEKICAAIIKKATL